MDRRGRPVPAGALVALLGVIGWALPSGAQPIDCGGLRRQIAALERGEGGRAAGYARSARRQQAEIDRTLAYRRSLGCDRQGVDEAPADCSRVDAQIDRMSANLANLQRYEGTDAGERANLIQQYDAYCGERGQWAYADPRSPYPDDRASPDEGFRRMPLDPDDGSDGRDTRRDEGQPDGGDQPEAGHAVGGPKAVCVKTCDGSFFPVSYSAGRGNLASLEALCRASCPNAETKLYTYDIYSEITQAVDKEGAPYTELPNALRYTKAYNPACSCRAPGKTWMETLTEAEKLYVGDKTDIVVTQAISDALARATQAAAPAVKPKPPRTSRQASRQASRRRLVPDLAPPSLAGTIDDTR